MYAWEANAQKKEMAVRKVSVTSSVSSGTIFPPRNCRKAGQQLASWSTLGSIKTEEIEQGDRCEDKAPTIKVLQVKWQSETGKDELSSS